jgi:hypothetical protein
MKSLLMLMLAATVAVAADPPRVQAVMYEFTYRPDTLSITHAQVIGGYPSVDECREAMPRVAAMGAAQLEAGELMQLQCSGIRVPDPSEDPATPQKPDLST